MGVASSILAYADLLQLVPEDQRTELVAAKNTKGTSALHVAMEKGDADAIENFASLLKMVPEDQRAKLLLAKNADSKPGLTVAVEKGNAQAIEAYGKLLNLIPKKDLGSVLSDIEPDLNSFTPEHAEACMKLNSLLRLMQD